MSRTIYIIRSNKKYFYCGWYQYSNERYPKYTDDIEVALKFTNKAYAINMLKSNNGYILIDNELCLANDEEFVIG